VTGMFNFSSRRVAGFSIIELIASVAILGLLASVAMPVIQTSITREKEYQLRIALRDIRSAIDAYKQATTNNLISSTQTPSGYPPNLTALAAGVPTIAVPPTPSQQMYFLRSVPRDPFFPDQTTPAIDTWAVRGYDDSNPPSDVFDVSSMSTQPGLNGIPYSQW
jgi:general secretion pathway protein G